MIGVVIVVGGLFTVAVISLFAAGITVIRPVEVGLVETFGKFEKIARPGFNYVIPFVQKVTKVNTTEIRVDVPPQDIITKDKLNAGVDAVVYYRIEDAKKAVYNVNNFKSSVPSLARTTLRAVIGKMTLTDANENRDKINTQVENELDKQTDGWGIDIVRVEIQRIEPPKDVQNAMNMVVKAENEKIAAMDLATAAETQADGFKRAEIKKAQGQKQARILKAEGEATAFDLINKAFTGNAIKLKKLEVTQHALERNSKIILTDKGIQPSLIIGKLDDLK